MIKTTCKGCPAVNGFLHEADCNGPECMGWHIEHNPKPSDEEILELLPVYSIHELDRNDLLKFARRILDLFGG